MPAELTAAPMSEPLRLTLELLGPLILAGLPLPAGTVIQLGADVAHQLLHQGRARLAASHRAPQAHRPPYR